MSYLFRPFCAFEFADCALFHTRIALYSVRCSTCIPSTGIETVSSFALIKKCYSSTPCVISPPTHHRCLRVLPTRRPPPWSSGMKISVARARTFGLARAEAVRSLGSKRGPSATIFTCTLSSGKTTNFDGNCLHSLNTKTSNIIQHTKHLSAGEQGNACYDHISQRRKKESTRLFSVERRCA